MDGALAIFRRKRGGFTVTEVMVALAMLAVVMYVMTAVVYGSYRASDGSVKKLQALQQARAAMERVKAIPLSQLPPERVAVAEGHAVTVQLRRHPLLAESLHLHWSDGSPCADDYTLNDDTGELTISSPTHSGSLSINYAPLIATDSGFRSYVRAEPAEHARLLVVETRWTQHGKTRRVELRRLRSL